jgi:hypothetical protein
MAARLEKINNVRNLVQLIGEQLGTGPAVYRSRLCLAQPLYSASTPSRSTTDAGLYPFPVVRGFLGGPLFYQRTAGSGFVLDRLLTFGQQF